MKLVVNWMISGIAVFLVANLLPGVHVDSFVTSLAVAFVLGIINAIVKPVLFILTLPITIMTLGLFSLVLNTVLILLTDIIVKGFWIDNFWWAFLFGIIFSIINSFLHKIVEK